MKLNRFLSRHSLIATVAAFALSPAVLPAQTKEPDPPAARERPNPPPNVPNFRPPPPPSSPPPSAHPRPRERDGEERREHRGRDSGVASDLLVLDRILAMPPEQLTRIREAIERVEKMSEEERKDMRDRLHEFRHLSPERRQEMREKWRKMTPEERRAKVQEIRDRHWREFFSESEDEELTEKPDSPTP